MGLRRAIEESIAEFIRNPPPTRAWLASAVAEYGFLPLYLGWTETWGITPDLTLVRWLTEDPLSHVLPLTNRFQQRLALKYGARTYPYLEPLCPQRPNVAIPCPSCRGTGTFPTVQEVVCHCGGYGWVIPGENREVSPR